MYLYLQYVSIIRGSCALLQHKIHVHIKHFYVRVQMTLFTIFLKYLIQMHHCKETILPIMLRYITCITQ